MTDFPSTTPAGQPALEAALDELAGEILCSVVEGGFCRVQEWDNRIDCCVQLDDGRIIGEAVPLATLSSKAIRAVGERIKQRMLDESSELQNELLPPILLSGPR